MIYYDEDKNNLILFKIDKNRINRYKNKKIELI
jgi:hypothetical protein